MPAHVNIHQAIKMKPQPKKSLGQHFLTDKNYCQKIVRFAQISPQDKIVEIGSGTGQLTKALLANAQRVLAIELDDSMVSYLQVELADQLDKPNQHLEILQADVLNLNWNSIIKNSPVKIVGNLPYNISTRILSTLSTVKHCFLDCTVMIQKEVAQRILAEPCSRNYGFFTLMMDYHFKRIFGFDVPPGVFVPKPKVTSSVIKLVPQKPIHSISDYTAFQKFLKTAFRQRRKILFNNLKIYYDTTSIGLALEKYKINMQTRPEEVTLKQYIDLFEQLIHQEP